MTDEWTAGRIEDPGGEGPPTVAEWRPVTVPTRRPDADIDEGTNDGNREGVAYRTVFDDPRTHDGARDGGRERAILELRGGYGRTTVWLNGTKLGETGPYFVPGRFTFEPEATNELIVACRAPEVFAGIHDTDAVPSSFATPGIRWGVDIEARPETVLRRLETRPRLERGDDDRLRGTIDVDLEVDAGAAIDDAVTLSVRPVERGGGATMERIPVEADAGERTTVSRSVEIRDPSLWWPRGHGPQHRYAVRAKLGGDERERTIGFRHVERDAEGFLVNGERVRARGFTRLPGVAPEADVRRALEANATLVRARGHVPDPAFHAACDAAGLLVWQDLPVSGAGIATRLANDGDDEPDLVQRGRELATTLVREYGHHPSVACYGVQDEPATPFDEPIGGGLTGKLTVRYRAWRASIDRSPADAIADGFREDVSVPVVPVAGQPGTDPDASHLFPGWQYLEATDLPWLLETYPSLGEVVGAIGAGALADGVEPDGIDGIDAELYARRAADPEASRTYQARTLKTIVETLRRRECGVFALETLRDVATGGGMGVTTVDGETKPAYETVADSLEPVQAVLDEPPAPGRSVGISLCNDTNKTLEGTVAWRAGEDGDETTVSVEAFETVAVDTVRIPDGAETVELAVQAGNRSATNEYDL
ncbi:glycoside hydrolase family 2 protein [Halobiforma nitratireducens]|uniref:Glycoside hydrolase family protein n=1 Tax=Halobiforma nitratireducens JCM 10879 TaxID=1227454 RepID=M0M8W7_9EURY|nr:glycoside hydrolase [Halobiforma nitratireducens]EMA41788.1 glycoside hydrolase family protein [Halobiforma nitratireducens JCM 10879]